MLVEPIESVTAADLATVGGKAANLGELVRAGFPVPAGFIVTTDAYSSAARDAGVDPADPAGSAERLRAHQVSPAIADAVRGAYVALGRGPVAVRSSATAEDLPTASFAGQQDTYLNVDGDEAVVDAVRRCWASLWNATAVAYRRAQAIDDQGVSLAVVVQRMVPAASAGVLFTADPLTGRRRRAAIEAVGGLGERLVSGAANPDHYLVETTARHVLERRLANGTGEGVLSDADLVELAALGDRVERHFGAPQDIEFAFDQAHRLWLVQSRPITTLYPLPVHQPDADRDLRVYFSGNVFQGYFEPLTPMGIQLFRLVATAATRAFGGHVADARVGPPFLAEAGMRLFIDVTPIMRNRLGRRVFTAMTGVGEARSSVVLSRLGSDPRLALGTEIPPRTLARIAAAINRAGIPARALPLLLRPDRTRRRYVREMDAIARVELPPDADAGARLDAVERLMLVTTQRLVPYLLGTMMPVLITLGLSRLVLRGRARADELDTLTRGAPHNPTTEMDLALWSASVTVRNDPAARDALLQQPPADLVRAYRRGALPASLQTALAGFLRAYGFRGIGEIDLGVPRWSDDPTHILGALANYVRLGDEVPAPDAQFARAQQQAEAMIATLLARLHGPRRLAARLVLRRLRQLVGSREAPKFHIIRLLMAPGRALLLSVGTDLAAQGRLETADDIFFLNLSEARHAVGGDDARAVVAARRAEFTRERARRHLPRVLLSDGTDAEALLIGPATGALVGSPASPGTVTGVARVVRNPHGAHLEPGEILVAPSTDPGWTPLFLTAGGLVMEMGGAMSHGAVVAREYGIPAVVGVPNATERISSGQSITVNGFAGTVDIIPAPNATPSPSLA